jgi:hypothetical protein
MAAVGDEAPRAGTVSRRRRAALVRNFSAP